MNPEVNDTHPEVERILIEGYRRMTVAEKWQRVSELNQRDEIFATAVLKKQYPQASENEIRLRVASRRIPAELMRLWMERTKMSVSDSLVVARIVSQTLENLGIPYLVGGSMASSAHGTFRATQDIDFVAEMKRNHIAEFVAALQADWYVDGEMIGDAIDTESSFNVIHLPTMYKADIFIKKPSAWSDTEFARRQIYEMTLAEPPFSVYIASPEDTILQKLSWYRLGGGVSDRQWGDIQGVLKEKQPVLDFEYLKKWATVLQVTDLLERACGDAKIAL